MGKKRKIGEINSSSMADIAFLLLIFFLVTTSMSTNTGLARRLPPPMPPQQTPPQVKKRNLLEVKINSMDQLMVQKEQMDIKDLKAKAEEFIQNPNNDPSLPEKVKENIPLLGVMEVTKHHVISVQNDVGTTYQAYIDVQNQLVAAYDDLRNKLAEQKFGKKFDDCTDPQKKAIQEVYKMNISEAEPQNYGGN